MEKIKEKCRERMRSNQMVGSTTMALLMGKMYYTPVLFYWAFSTNMPKRYDLQTVVKEIIFTD